MKTKEITPPLRDLGPVSATDDKALWFVRDFETQALTRRAKVKLLLWRIVDALLFKTSLTIFKGWRVWLLRMFGAKIGHHCYVSPKAIIQAPWNFSMGHHSSLDDFALMKCANEVIELEDYVSISVGVHIVPDGHDVRARNFAYQHERVIIRNGCFIGADSYIGKGVEIGQFSVVGAKSVVLKSIPENSIAYGFPCVVHGERISEADYMRFRYGQ